MVLALAQMLAKPLKWYMATNIWVRSSMTSFSLIYTLLVLLRKLKGKLFFTLEINPDLLFTLLPVIDYGDTLYVSSSVLRSLQSITMFYHNVSDLPLRSL